MAKKDTPRPIGFGRIESDPNKENRFLWKEGKDAEEEELGPPPRLPKAAPVYVGAGEGLEILKAYDLFPLTPLSNLEQQLLQVVAGLEQRIEELS